MSVLIGGGIRFFHVAAQCSALKLEILGLKHSKGSVYAHCKRVYGFKGNRQKVLDQMVAMKKSLMEECAASFRKDS